MTIRFRIAMLYPALILIILPALSGNVLAAPSPLSQSPAVSAPSVQSTQLIPPIGFGKNLSPDSKETLVAHLQPLVAAHWAYWDMTHGGAGWTLGCNRNHSACTQHD